MPAAQRLNDKDSGGGAINSIPQGTVFINDQLVSVNGSDVEGHGRHSSTKTANGSPTVFVGNVPVNRQGDEDECGHKREDGSPNVFVGP